MISARRWPGAPRIGLSVCALLALATLPAAMFPWPWFLALLAPATLALPLARTPLRPFERIVLLGALQIVALATALHFAGPLHRLAALAGTLLPPLAFLALRSEPLDILRGVFLSFCVLLIGAILGDPSALHVLAFVAVAVLTLQADVASGAAEERASARGPRPARGRRAATASTVMSACLIACLLTLHGLRAVPAPSEDDVPPPSTASSGAGNSSVGPTSDFDFQNLPGSLLTMRSNRLVRVASADRRPVPPDLYLRCAHFDVAGLDRWDTRRARIRPLATDADGTAIVARPRPDQPDRRMLVELTETAAGFAYVPPGTFVIRGADGLEGDLGAGVFRYRNPPPPPVVYGVAFQSVRHDEITELPDARLAGLTEVGDDLRRWRGTFEEILAGADLGREVEPMAVAQAIADQLHARCSYALREPTGPHRHSILNFLDGNHEGFCMHFASVTAICLRLAGIPARIGAGLYGGAAAADEYGVREYGSQHAHAWVEIPFAGLGWVVFDPTPPAARENLRWLDFGAEDAGDGQATESPASRLGETRLTIRALDDVWPWIAALAVAAVLFSVRWQRDGTQRTTAARISPDAKTARRLLERILRDLAAHGHTRYPGETLERYAARLRAQAVGGQRLRDAFAAYQEIRFGDCPFDASRRARLEHRLTAPGDTD